MSHLKILTSENRSRNFKGGELEVVKQLNRMLCNLKVDVSDATYTCEEPFVSIPFIRCRRANTGIGLCRSLTIEFRAIPENKYI